MRRASHIDFFTWHFVFTHKEVIALGTLYRMHSREKRPVFSEEHALEPEMTPHGSD